MSRRRGPTREEWIQEIRRQQQSMRDLFERQEKEIDPALYDLTAKGAQAMVTSQASPPPAVIQILRVLLDRSAYPTHHVKWIEDGARAVLKNWEVGENIKQLTADLGLNQPKRRRRELTMQRETAIVAAIVEAALAGDASPKQSAGDKLQADDREVQRAWKKWKAVYLARLAAAAAQTGHEDQPRMQAALDHLQNLK